MENTGRITRTLTPTARRILYGETAGSAIERDMFFITEVDRAHIVMLGEQGIIDGRRGRALLRAIETLRRSRFSVLRERHAPRGLYLLYEHYLAEILGDDVAGVLHTARSRNDLNATVLQLRLRQPYSHCLREALRLVAIMLRRADRFRQVVMPIYTHYQAAVPVSYGHYLAGVAVALERDIAGLIQAGSGLEECPLGAGAAGGTSVPIDPQRTAALLGFRRPTLHSIDAVASRDLVLRVLAALSVLGTTLSRLATDLLLWSTAEFSFLTFPDTLVGSSSMMPQKRNPFLLEHIQARGTAPLGAFVAAAAATHATPFTNSIAVGTEATDHVWEPLRTVTEALALARLMVAGAQPQPDAMLQRAAAGYTSATALADRLVVEHGMAFRLAHRIVGEIVRGAIDQGEPLEAAAERALVDAQIAIPLDDLDPGSVAGRSVHGGGPGTSSLDACLHSLRAQWGAQAQQCRALGETWRRTPLDEAVTGYLSVAG